MCSVRNLFQVLHATCKIVGVVASDVDDEASTMLVHKEDVS